MHGDRAIINVTPEQLERIVTSPDGAPRCPEESELKDIVTALRGSETAGRIAAMSVVKIMEDAIDPRMTATAVVSLISWGFTWGYQHRVNEESRVVIQ